MCRCDEMRLRASEKRDGKSEVITHSSICGLDFTCALIKTVLRYTSFQSAPIFAAIVIVNLYVFYATVKKSVDNCILFLV